MTVAWDAKNPKHLPLKPNLLRTLAACAALSMAVAPLPALAHVKWFAPYDVQSAPASLAQTLLSGWVWLGMALVLTFFLLAVLIELRIGGNAVVSAGDRRATNPLWLRADDFMRAIIGAFFVAIFAIGGVYLTPELHTHHEWVSWMQLLIAVMVFSRHTMPLSAAGIIGLWVMALGDYDLFHLLDYLPLGLGVAGYLALAAFPTSKYFDKRFAVLRCGVAIAVMWSSFEKLAYPEWFYPLIEERPFLTLGLPRDAFIPMAGVAEFAMGLGLLWTPLVRRLSAIALLTFFTLAVYPFGRVDLIGHALIMGSLVLTIANPIPFNSAISKGWQAIAKVPSTFAATMIIIGGAYWGSHAMFYGHSEGNHAPQTGQLAQGATVEHSSPR